MYFAQASVVLHLDEDTAQFSLKRERLAQAIVLIRLSERVENPKFSYCLIFAQASMVPLKRDFDGVSLLV